MELGNLAWALKNFEISSAMAYWIYNLIFIISVTEGI